MKVCIVGVGKMGYTIARALLDGGNGVTIIDCDAERIQNAGNTLDAFTIQGDALKAETLKNIEINSHDLIIAATESDESNLVICSLAKKLGCPKAMARVRSPQHITQSELLRETFGIEQLLNPDYACALEIFKYLTQQYALEGGMFVKDGIAIHEFEINKLPELISKKVSESSALLSGLLIGAISRGGKIVIPNGSTGLEENDTLYVVGQENDIRSFASKMVPAQKDRLPQRVMIAGGGKTGFFLAGMLEEKGIGVKIIEQNADRCKELAAELNYTTILQGDASEITVLREEGLDSMDAFVAATGFDEENLLLSMLVKKFGVEEVVAKVSRETYSPIIKDLGTSAVINPQQIIANNILNFVRRNGIVVFSKLINGQAEFREIQAESTMPLTRKNLAELTIPDGVIIIAVRRDNSVIIPNGQTQINPGDKVVLLSMLSAGGELESLLTKAQTSIL